MTTIARGRYLLSGVSADGTPEIIDNGAIAYEDGRILDVGQFEALASKYNHDEVIGSLSQFVIPGLVNSHHHVGLTPFQLGAVDMPLELWTIRRLAARSVDPYLDTLYSAFELVQSGVTTVLHIQDKGRGFFGPREARHEAVAAVLKAYSDVGLRVTYALGIRDQNRFVYGDGDDHHFLQTLPLELRRDLTGLLKRVTIPIDDQLAFFGELLAEYPLDEKGPLRIQLAPINVQWCSDRTLSRVSTLSEVYGVRLHVHLLETPYQEQYAYRTYGRSPVSHLGDLGLLGSDVTLAHVVWLSPDDADLLQGTGTSVCLNVSSNLRLRSGVAPVHLLAERGIPFAIGIDEAGINDDRDMLQEMRLLMDLQSAVHGRGVNGVGMSAGSVLSAATAGGAQVTGYGSQIGKLESGRAADFVLVNWDRLTWPYLDSSVPIVDALVRRARTSTVDTVVVAGVQVFRDGLFTRVDKEAILTELADQLSNSRTSLEHDQMKMADALFPHVKAFFDNWPVKRN